MGDERKTSPGCPGDTRITPPGFHLKRKCGQMSFSLVALAVVVHVPVQLAPARALTSSTADQDKTRNNTAEQQLLSYSEQQSLR